MDIIVESYFNKFLKEQKITDSNKDKNFEKFINYICLVSKNFSNYDLMSTCVGNGNDAGIDGLAITINNRFVTNMADLTDILNLGMDFNVEFFFIQTKTSESFEVKEIGTFGDGVSDMFRSQDSIKKIMNEDLKLKYLMIQKIIENYEYSKERKCHLYYITPGKYVEDENLLSIKSRIKETLINQGIFLEDDIKVHIKDRSYIRKQYEQTKVQNTATFQISQKIDIPYVDGVEESYLVLMPINEYLKIVIDDNNRMRRGIFELNVRDFAGIEDNRVNQDIESTINSNEKSAFGLFNNGITIVGKSLDKGQGKYTIKNFYIVNGCQTTNVLFKNRDKIDESMWVSVKIVITQNDNIIEDIVKATNNQTVVEEIQLLSMEDYQKELESYFDTFDKYTKLYYERRSGQYSNRSEVEPLKIVNLESLMKSFASVILMTPHLASRYLGKLQEEIEKKIFIKDHRPIMYYTSALLNYKLEQLFINDKIACK